MHANFRTLYVALLNRDRYTLYRYKPYELRLIKEKINRRYLTTCYYIAYWLYYAALALVISILYMVRWRCCCIRYENSWLVIIMF